MPFSLGKTAIGYVVLLYTYSKTALAYAKVRLRALNGSDEPAREPSDFDPFEWYMAAGDHQAAITILKAKVANKDHVLFEMLMGPLSDPIFNDPGFQTILNRRSLSVLKAARFHPVRSR